MIEKAIVSLARIQLYPIEHPAALMVALADDASQRTWLGALGSIMNSNRWASAIPRIWDTEICPKAMLKLAQVDASVRRNVLRRYKWQVVRPVLQAADAKALQDDCA